MPDNIIAALAERGVLVTQENDRWVARGRIGQWKVTIVDSTFGGLCELVLVNLKEATDA